MQVRWTEPAAQDIEAIAEFISNDSPVAAEQVVKALFDAANSLGRFSSRGRLGRIPGTRELVVLHLPYIVVYRITDSAIQILRIYHGARDWPEKL